MKWELYKKWQGGDINCILYCGNMDFVFLGKEGIYLWAEKVGMCLEIWKVQL